MMKIFLIDKKTEKVNGEITTNREISIGGFYSIGAGERILDIVVTDVVDAIDKKMKGN